MANSVNINPNSNNNITIQDNNGNLSVTNNNTGTTVSIPQPVTNVVTVAAIGPQGPVGPIPSSGSFTGSFSGSFVGDLTGTASNAISSSYAVNSTNSVNSVSASYAIDATNAVNAQNAISASYALTASYLTGYVSPFPFSGSAVITGSLTVSGSSTLTNIGPAIFSGSLIVTQGITGSLSGSALTATSASYAQNATSASFALTASYLTGYVSPFPFTGSAIISGSLTITGSVQATGGFSGSFSGSGANLFDIPASGITGLNLSRIATGSISASVSPGTASFAIVSGSSTFMFVSSSGNVGVRTTTPSSPLHIKNSTTNYLGGLTLEKSDASLTYNLYVDGSNGFAIAKGASGQYFTINQSGNVLINTTTDSGYKLDVNGPGNYEGNLRLGVGFQLLFNNNNVGLYRSANALRLGGFGGIEFLASNTNISAQSIRMTLFDTGNFAIGTTTDSGFRFDVSGSARISGTGNVFTINETSNSRNFTFNPSYATSVYGGFINHSLGHITLGASLGTDNGSNLGIFLGGPSGNRNASALLQIDSTSRGFLPPRMTAAQRVAISSPASGLIVYDTGSVTTEGVWVYETTGWQQLLTNSGSQSISGSLNVTSFTASNATISGNVTVLGTASINTLVVNQIGYSSGSNQLGDAADDTQTLFGTVRIPTGSLTVTGSIDSSTSLNGDLDNLTIRNLSNGTAAQTRIRFYNELTPSSTTGGAIFYTSNAYSGFPANSFGFWNYNTNGIIAFATSAERMRIASTGNVLIGTTTDAGFRLDVNGSARSTAFRLTDNTLIASAYTVGGTTLTISNGGHNNATGINVTSAVGIQAFSSLGASNNNVLGASIYAAGGGSGTNISLGLLSNRALITSVASGMAMHTSSMLQVDSTTQGFLPPRTNLTSNISTPAQGLMTYVTASATEGLYYYSSGSIRAWTRLLNDTGSQAISGSLTITGSNPLLRLNGSGSELMSVDGASGRLFTVSDDLSNSLFSVNTIAGLPVIEAFATNDVFLGKYNTYPIKTVASGTLAVITGSFSGSVVGTLTGTSSFALTASYVNPLVQNVQVTGSIAATSTITGGGSTSYNGIAATAFGATATLGYGGVGSTGGTSFDIFQNGSAAIAVAQDRNVAIGAGGGNAAYGIARLLVKGSGATSATTALLVQNSNTSASLTVFDNGNISIGSTTNSFYQLYGTGAWFNSGTIYTPLLYTNNITPAAGGSNNFYTNANNFKIGTTSTATTSAIFEIASTTLGFLPPRTNLTSNISTPAQGLMTYVTASATEGLYYYNSGSTPGWRQVADTTFVSASLSGSAGYLPVFTGANSVSSSVIFQSGSSVGIGTTTPANTLDVSGSTRVNGTLIFATDGSGANGLSFTRNGSNNWTWGTVQSPGMGNILTITGNLISIPQVVTTSNGLNVTPGGNQPSLGLGVTSGSYPSAVIFRAGVNNIVVTGSRVGIGTTNPLPTSTLNVVGTTVLSGSFNTAASGSILTVIGSGSAQPIFTVQGSQGELFSITDSLSGSLFSVNDISGLPILEVFSDNTTLIGNYQDPMLITTAKVVQTNSGSFTVYSLPTASYDTAFFEYSIKSGSNARAGTIMAIQLGSTVNFTETTTTDFGDTTPVSFTVIVTGSNMALTGSSTTGSWTIKTIVRGL